jgi:hypothetical protein
VKDTLYAFVCIFLKTAFFFLGIMLIVILSPALRFPGRIPATPYFLYQIYNWGAAAFFSAVFLALISTHFRIIRKPGKKPLTFALVFVSSFLILYSGLYGLAVFFPEIPKADAYDAGASIPAERNVVQRAGDVFLWIGDTAEASAGPVVLLDEKEARNFHVYSRGFFDPETGILKLFPGDAGVSLEEPGPLYFSPFLRAFIADLSYIANIIRPRTFVDIPALCSVFSLVFFGFSLWTLAKLSRWPLFNLWFTLGTIWLVFSGIRFLGKYIAPELVRFEQLQGMGGYLPVIFPGVCAFVLFFAGLRGRPLEKWKREMRSEEMRPENYCDPDPRLLRGPACPRGLLVYNGAAHQDRNA